MPVCAGKGFLEGDYMNKVILVGRLAKDPELRATQSGTAVVSFSVACDRRFTKEGERSADFISCTAWGKTAEFISRYFTKGMRIALSGRIETRSWEDDKGNKRYATEVVVEEVEFAQSKGEGSSQALAAPNAELDGFMPVEDEDLPF